MKRTPLRKKGKSKVSTLKRKLWSIFSKYIRERDKYTCFTCGKKATGSGMHAGHYIPKSVGGIALYFNEKNVHAQCYHCNINLSGNSDIYMQRLVAKYGEEVIEEIRELRQQINKWSIEDYEIKIQHYTTKVEGMCLT